MRGKQLPEVAGRGRAELREMLAEAVRNTAQPQPKPPTKAKDPKKAA
jgi:hypothetical protein